MLCVRYEVTILDCSWPQDGVDNKTPIGQSKRGGAYRSTYGGRKVQTAYAGGFHFYGHISLLC